LETIWHSEAFFEPFRNKEKHLSGGCRKCPAGPQCRAGCTSIAVSATGDIGDNPWCIRRIETENILNGIGIQQ
jgi:radical SAM protein with 4Fe4S-binding SPASM domain